MRNLLITLFALLQGHSFTSCNGHPQNVRASEAAHPPGYTWIEQIRNAPFPKSYNFQLFSIRDTLWAFHPDGNWYSSNGKDWTKSVLTNSINNLCLGP